MAALDGYTPWPLDFRLLEILPDKGLIGGVHWKGRRSKDLAKEIGDELVSAGLIAARLRELRKYGLAVQHPDGSGLSIWARTDEGRAFLERKEEFLG